MGKEIIFLGCVVESRAMQATGGKKISCAQVSFHFSQPIFRSYFFVHFGRRSFESFLHVHFRYISASTIVRMLQSVNRNLNLLTNPIVSS